MNPSQRRYVQHLRDQPAALRTKLLQDAVRSRKTNTKAVDEQLLNAFDENPALANSLLKQYDYIELDDGSFIRAVKPKQRRTASTSAVKRPLTAAQKAARALKRQQNAQERINNLYAVTQPYSVVHPAYIPAHRQLQNAQLVQGAQGAQGVQRAQRVQFAQQGEELSDYEICRQYNNKGSANCTAPRRNRVSICKYDSSTRTCSAKRR